MTAHFGLQFGHLACKLRQRGGIAFGQLADASGEGLRDAVQFPLHSGGEGGQPLVVHHKRLDLGLGELAIFRGDLFREGFLRGLELRAGAGFLLAEGEVAFKSFLF